MPKNQLLQESPNRQLVGSNCQSFLPKRIALEEGRAGERVSTPYMGSLQTECFGRGDLKEENKMLPRKLKE